MFIGAGSKGGVTVMNLAEVLPASVADQDWNEGVSERHSVMLAHRMAPFRPCATLDWTTGGA